VVAPLYAYEGDRYNGPVDEDAWSLVIKNIYKIIGYMEDYFNHIENEELISRSVDDTTHSL